jgi:hypothetical protein
VGQKVDLGAVEADSLGAVQMGEGDVAEQTDVGIERDAVTVLSFRGKIPQLAELFVER